MVRRTLITALVVFTLFLGLLATPAEAASCKLTTGEQVECTCAGLEQITINLYKATCNVTGKPTMNCISVQGPAGPWRCDETLNYGYTYSTPTNDCTYNTAGAGRGAGGGSALSQVYAYEHSFSTGSCGAAWNRPPGSLAALIQFYRWSGSSWSLCRDSGWYYNNVSTWGWEVSWAFGSTPPCGAGYYHTAGFGSQFNGFSWRGGYRAADYLYISGISPLSVAGNSSVTSEPPPDRPMTASDLRVPALPLRAPTKVPAQHVPEGLSVRSIG